MTPERAIEVLKEWPWVGDFEHVHPDEQHEATDMGAAALAEVAALRAELAEAKAMLDKVGHDATLENIKPVEWVHEPDCLACARDRRWPVKETPR